MRWRRRRGWGPQLEEVKPGVPEAEGGGDQNSRALLHDQAVDVGKPQAKSDGNSGHYGRGEPSEVTEEVGRSGKGSGLSRGSRLGGG